MTFRNITIVSLTIIFSACLTQAIYCPAKTEIFSFNCPRAFDKSDEIFCCNEYQADNYCCDGSAWSVGAIVGVSIGIVVAVGLSIAGCIACCVCCCVQATRPPPPMVTHVQAPAQPAMMSVNALPSYNAPTNQPPPKVGQYQHLVNEPINSV